MPASAQTKYGDDCVLMLQFGGADGSQDFIDASFVTTKIVTAIGHAQIDTAQKPFGTSSGLFDGTGDYLSIPDSPDWDFGTGDFTIDLQIKYNSYTAAAFYDNGGFGVGEVGVRIIPSGLNIEVDIVNSAYNFAYVNMTDGNWHHIALTRAGTSLRMFEDGVQIGITESNSGNITGSTRALLIGDDYNGNSELNGWLASFRVVKGQALYTSNFTPPSAPYAVAGGATGNYFQFFE